MPHINIQIFSLIAFVIRIELEIFSQRLFYEFFDDLKRV